MRSGAEIESIGRLLRGALAMTCNRLLHRKSAPAPQLEFRAYGSHAPFDRDIPRIVWLYWDEENLPLLIERCLDNMRRLNPGFTVNLLHPGNIDRFISQIPRELSSLTVQMQSDWFRLYLLKTYGGIWVDASTVLTRSLEWVLQIQQEHRSELVGFYIDRYTTKPETPVLESWFIAAIPESPFIANWYALFTDEIVFGGVAQCIERLQQTGYYESLVQVIDMPEYLVIHLLAQELMQHGPSARLSLARAEDCAFFYQSEASWRRKALHAELLFKPASESLPNFVKLRNADRTYFERYLSSGVYLRDSVVGQALSRASVQS